MPAEITRMHISKGRHGGNACDLGFASANLLQVVPSQGRDGKRACGYATLVQKLCQHERRKFIGFVSCGQAKDTRILVLAQRKFARISLGRDSSLARGSRNDLISALSNILDQ